SATPTRPAQSYQCTEAMENMSWITPLVSRCAKKPSVHVPPLPSWERSTRVARRERGGRRRRLLRRLHPLPNPSPIKGEGLKTHAPSLLICRGATLAQCLEQRDTGRHRHIEAFHATTHRDARKKVAGFARQAPHAL